MSHRAITWAWEQSLENASLKLVLLKLADCSNDEGVSWPSQKLLAADCGMSDRNIRYKLAELAQLGLIEIEERTRANGSRTSNFYRLGGGSPLPGGLESPFRGGRQLVSGPDPEVEPSVEPTTGGRKRDVVWDELAADLGEPTNKQTRAKRNTAVKLIKESLAALELEEEDWHREIRKRLRRYRQLFPSAPLTDTALANQWDALGWSPGLGPAIAREEVDYGPELTPEEIEENKQRVKELAARVSGAMQLTVDGREVPHDDVVNETKKEA